MLFHGSLVTTQVIDVLKPVVVRGFGGGARGSPARRAAPASAASRRAKRWPAIVEQRPQVVLRADGRLFERIAVPVIDPARHAELIAAGQAKYGAPFHARWAARVTRYFRLEPAPTLAARARGAGPLEAGRPLR